MNEESLQPLSNEAPDPPKTGEEMPRVVREPISLRQWFAILMIICLLVAMFLYMHGEKLW